MATKKVITPQDLDSTIVFNPATKKWGVQLPAQSDGLDCEAIKQLPEKEWSKGTTVLAQTAQGECYRLITHDNVVADVGVALSASRRVGFTGEDYRVTATVTNTGEATVETRLLLVKPDGTNYTIKDWQTSGSNGVVIERNSDVDYTIKNLGTANRATVSFTVVPTEYGTYQFGASVTTKGFDISATNDSDSIILSANTKTDPNYTPTVNCPAITITDVETTERLALYGTYTTSTGTFIPSNFFSNTQGYMINYINADTLSGRRFRLDGASTIVVYRQRKISLSPYFRPDNGVIMASNGDTFLPPVVGSGRVDKQFPVDTESISLNNHTSIVSNYTFENNVLTFADAGLDYDPVFVAMRPAGDNCNWQCVVIAPKYTGTIPTNSISISGLESNLYTIARNLYQIGRPTDNVTKDLIGVNFIGGIPNGYTRYLFNRSADRINTLSFTETVEINIPRNTAKTFTITATTDINFSSAGAVAVSSSRNTATVTVSNTAQPTDSISLYNGRIVINIV